MEGTYDPPTTVFDYADEYHRVDDANDKQERATNGGAYQIFSDEPAISLEIGTNNATDIRQPTYSIIYVARDRNRYDERYHDGRVPQRKEESTCRRELS